MKRDESQTHTKSRGILIAITSFALGLIVAGGGAALIVRSLTERFVSNHSAAEIVTSVATLERIRSGETNAAIGLLELKLDAGIVGIGIVLEGISTEKRDPVHINALKMANKYRIQNPRKTDKPEFDAVIAKALALMVDQK